MRQPGQPIHRWLPGACERDSEGERLLDRRRAWAAGPSHSKCSWLVVLARWHAASTSVGNRVHRGARLFSAASSTPHLRLLVWAQVRGGCTRGMVTSEPYLLFLKKSLIALCNCTVDKCSKSPNIVQNRKLFKENTAGQAGAIH